MILVGERAAGLSGTFSACHRLAERTGAKLAWVPRRAGDRGAVEAGCLPNLLPGGRPVADAAARVDTQATWGVESLPSLEGRDADEILIAATDGELEALVVAGVDPNDFVDPQAVLEGLEAAEGKVKHMEVYLQQRRCRLTVRECGVPTAAICFNKIGVIKRENSSLFNLTS